MSNTINQDEAKRQLDEDRDIVLIDVRETSEYRCSHIKNAINIPQSILPIKIHDYVEDKNKKIFVYCLSGGRSESSLRLLQGLGYDNVYNIGGIASWKHDIVY